MIFVLLTDENTLLVYEDQEKAVMSCEGVDVEDGICLFFDESGLPLEPVFTTPNRRGSLFVVSGRYHLRPAGTEMNPLFKLLPRVVNVEGPPPLQNLMAVKHFLATRSRSWLGNWKNK